MRESGISWSRQSTPLAGFGTKRRRFKSGHPDQVILATWRSCGRPWGPNRGPLSSRGLGFVLLEGGVHGLGALGDDRLELVPVDAHCWTISSRSGTSTGSGPLRPDRPEAGFTVTPGIPQPPPAARRYPARWHKVARFLCSRTLPSFSSDSVGVLTRHMITLSSTFMHLEWYP
jgi:hypothetical protein